MNKPISELTLRELIEQNRLETEIRPDAAAVRDPAASHPVTRRSFLAGLSAGSLLLMCRVGRGHAAEVADPARTSPKPINFGVPRVLTRMLEVRKLRCTIPRS